MNKHTKTLRVRIKDKHKKLLLAMSRDVNTVWNYCNEISHKAIVDRKKFLSGFDLNNLTSGFTKCEGVLIGAHTTQEVCENYAIRRKQFKKSKLKWRVSNRKRSTYSMGWVPFKKGSIKYKNGQIKFLGHHFSLWDSYGLSKYEFRSGSFSEDSRGRWYLNVVVSVDVATSSGTKLVGIDLGLKECAVTSDGDRLEGRNYRKLEEKLRKAQRAKKKTRTRAIHAKIKNKRKDEQHKFTTKLIKDYGAVFIGNVNSNKLVKTKMAKSVLDAGWGQLKTMLEYKSRWAGVVYMEVNENYTTQTCSCCGAISANSPKGRAGLRIREWTCTGCGALHDRDINAARNILALGHERLAVGIPFLQVGGGCQ